MTSTKSIVIIVLLIAVGWLVYLLSPILTPFVVAALLAYITNPIVKALERVRVPRLLGVILVFLLFTLVLIGLVFYLVPKVSRSIQIFSDRLPDYYEWLITQLQSLAAWLGVTLELDTLRNTLTGHWNEVGQWATKALDVARQSGLAVVGVFFNLVLIPILTFYLLLDWEGIVSRIDALLPVTYRSRVRSLAAETDGVLGSFLRGQLLVMATLAVYYSVGLLIVGLDLALPIGLLTGLLAFVPYLGFTTGIVAALIAAYLQFHEWIMLLWVLVVYMIGQGLETYVLTPRLVGKRIGLHPVVVIFAVLAGGQLFGFFGVLIALPAAAAIKVWLRQAHETFVNAGRSRRK